jgi:N-acetylneuraminate synthase
MANVFIAGREIGPGQPPYVVAELSGNHQGSLERALALLDEAARCGADAVKLQTFTPDTITIAHDGPGFVLNGGLWAGRTLHDLYAEAHTPYAWHEALFARGRELGVTVFSSPFDETAVDLLESLGAPAYKIASFEAIDLPLIARAARTGKPLIISTGMTTPEEIEEAATVARTHRPKTAEEGGLILLHCVSSYPARYGDANLATVPDLARRFHCVAGLSDHTPGTAASVAAVALGANFIEKHFCMSRAEGGVDAAFSLEPAELRALVADCRNAFDAIGGASYTRSEAERANLQFRRSLYAVAPIKAGEMFTAENVRSIRPGFGLPPKHIDAVLGQRATRDIAYGEPMTWEMVGALAQRIA